jgi:hypothetical protein
VPSKTALSGLAGTGKPEAAGCACQSGIAPGISYDYGKIGVTDVGVMTALRQTCPGGFISPAERVTLHRKVKECEGAAFMQTVPSGNYRCLAGSACLRERRLGSASLFQERQHVQYRRSLHRQGAGSARPGQGGRLGQRTHRLLSQYSGVVPGC